MRFSCNTNDHAPIRDVPESGIGLLQNHLPLQPAIGKNLASEKSLAKQSDSKDKILKKKTNEKKSDGNINYRTVMKSTCTKANKTEALHVNYLET